MIIFTIFFKLYECDNLDLLLVVAKRFLCFKNFVLCAGTKSSGNTIVSLLSGNCHCLGQILYWIFMRLISNGIPD